RRPRDPGLSFFFFQAEDGIRDLIVTGVQTCALPIWARHEDERDDHARGREWQRDPGRVQSRSGDPVRPERGEQADPGRGGREDRSEERRVGKEWRVRWWPEH